MLSVVCLTSAASAQGTVAFHNVNLVAMDQERLEPSRTVIVQGDRIVAIEAAAEVSIPSGAIVIDGSGRLYLAPGLTDSHVHLSTDMEWAPARPDFGDGLLYLAYGVTTVVNLRGNEIQLDWRRRINSGELLGPTIYTSGEFINEPRVRTRDDVRREVMAQARDGFDLLKFHEVWIPARGYVTSTGLSRDAYLEMFDAARQAGLPIVGHAPVNLGIDALFASAGGALAHAGELNRLYFLPDVRVFAASFGALLVAMLIGGGWGLVELSRRWRRAPRERTRTLRRAQMVTAVTLLTSIIAAISLTCVFPGGWFFESVAWRVAVTVLIVVVLVETIVLIGAMVALWFDVATRGTVRALAAALSLAVTIFAVGAAAHLMPVAWRSRPVGVDDLAERFRQSGVSLQSTLVVYSTLDPETRQGVFEEPAFRWLSVRTREVWRSLATQGNPEVVLAAVLIPRFPEFIQRVIGAMQRHDVRLLAGTDAMGLPFVVPGASLHRELEMLVQSGLTPYQAIRSATVNPAQFLNKDFGTIGVGRRADLILLDGNPLQNVTVLKEPLGVMVRGHWLTRERLKQLLAALPS